MNSLELSNLSRRNFIALAGSAAAAIALAPRFSVCGELGHRSHND